MTVGEPGQTLKSTVAEQVVGTGAEPACDRTGQRPVEKIDVGEQLDVGVGVAARKRPPWDAATIREVAGGTVLIHQTVELGA